MTYSTTLALTATAGQTEIYVAAAPSAPYPEFIQIGTEILSVVAVQTQFATPTLPTRRIRLAVRRAQLGTVAATHSSSAAVDAVTIAVQTAAPTAPPSETVGGDVPTNVATLYGPFHVAWDTAGFINTSGIHLLALDAGSAVHAHVVVTETFDEAGELDLSVQTDSDGYLLVGLTNPVRLSVNAVGSAAQVSLGGRSGFGTVEIACNLDASFTPTGADPTAGAADIYVLVATPA